MYSYLSVSMAFLIILMLVLLIRYMRKKRRHSRGNFPMFAPIEDTWEERKPEQDGSDLPPASGFKNVQQQSCKPKKSQRDIEIERLYEKYRRKPGETVQDTADKITVDFTGYSDDMWGSNEFNLFPNVPRSRREKLFYDDEEDNN